MKTEKVHCLWISGFEPKFSQGDSKNKYNMVFQHPYVMNKPLGSFSLAVSKKSFQVLYCFLTLSLQKNATFLYISCILSSSVFSVNHQNSFPTNRKVHLTFYESDLSKQERPLSHRSKLEEIVVGQHFQKIAQVMGEKLKCQY